jgi:putative peptide zinc metalloprotease protein
MSGCARLRPDLVTSLQEVDGVQRIVVKDPTTGRFFRFKEHEFFIAQQFDGTTGEEEVRRRVETKFGATVSEQALMQFVGKLRGIGLLDGEAVEAKERRGAGRKLIHGTLLYLRWPAINPDRLFNWLIPRIRFLFTFEFVALSTVLIAIGFGVSIAGRGEMLRYLSGLYRVETLFLAWVTLIAATTLHEFAHGLTCKYFGGKVQEIGFMLIYFQPALYCNVSDAWLFPERAKRLWVTFAGAYFDLMAWALSTIVWRVCDPTTLVSYLAFVIMATSAVKTFFNLNPLIKLDGYYLLSDFLEIPNLRRRSFSYLGALIRRLGGFRSPVLAEATSRERFIYIVYGLLAWSYSFWLLSFICTGFFNFLVSRYQAWGFLIFTAMFTSLFSHPLRRGLGQFSSQKATAPAAISTGMRRWLKVFGAFGFVSGVFFIGRMELKVSGEFSVRPAQNAELRAEIDGVIQEIPFDEGQQVQKGDTIARLSDRDWRSEMRKTEAEIDEKRTKLLALRSGPRPEQIEMARTTVEKARERLRYGKSNFDRVNSLFRASMVAKNKFEEAEEELSVRQSELNQAEGALKFLTSSTTVEETTFQAELKRLCVQEEYIKEQLGLLQMQSPISGIVATPKIKEKIGQYVEKGSLIAEIHEINSVKAEIAVPEKEISDVQIGQRVLIKLRAYPERDFEGTVASIAPVVTKASDELKSASPYEQRTVLVTTRLDNPELLLRSDMTGHAKICCGERRLVDVATRRLVRYLRVEFWSWW